MQPVKILEYLSWPFLALFSRRFYYDVLIKMRGAGLRYLLLFSLALALPASFQVKEILNRFKTLELSTVVAQIPASNISPEGVLTPADPANTEPFLIKNSSGEVVMAWNLENKRIDGEPIHVPITIASHAAIIDTTDGTISVPWTSLYGSSGAQFEPLAAAQVLDEAFNASIILVWLVVGVRILFSMTFVVLAAAILTRVFMPVVVRVRVPFTVVLRLNAYASSVVGFFMLAQFFLNMSVSYLLLCAVPAVYCLSFLGNVRRVLDNSVNSVDYALNRNNPFYMWFEARSRIDENGNIERTPDYWSLSPEDQARRRNNLQNSFRNNAQHTVNSAFHSDMGSHWSQGAHGGQQQSGQSQDSWSGAPQGRRDDDDHPHQTGISPDDDSRSRSFDNDSDGPGEHNAQEGKTPNPYIFNDQTGADDPVFKEHMENAPERGQVRSGAKGEDSSFTP